MQQLYAKIKKSSKYSGQETYAIRDGVYPFPVEISKGTDGYVVKGGPGGQYRLADVTLHVLVGDKQIRIKG